MNHEKLTEALEQISDRHIAEAVRGKKRRPYWLGAVAAVLAVVILVSAPSVPTAHAEGLLASPTYPEMAPHPNGIEDGAVYDAWRGNQIAQYNQPKGYADSLHDYFARSIPILLDSNAENAVCSPVNLYMALAMLAECSDGSARRQILKLTGADSLKALRTQAGQVWNAHYCDDGATTSLLANSLWLDNAEDLAYNPETVQTLADSYYASVYRGDLGSDAMNQALRDWLNDSTGGLLKEQAKDLELAEETVLALASAIYYRARWRNEFSEGSTENGVFHASAGDITCGFMKADLPHGPYYYGEDYGGVSLNLDDGSQMWLILPDEGFTPRDILESGHALETVLAPDQGESTAIKVHLSLPKFDVASDREISQSLQELGLTKVFQKGSLSAIVPAADAYLSKIDHAARVRIDEKGAEAAAYTVMEYYGVALPLEEEINFVLNRPFLFVITSRGGLPLFAGIVNNP